MKGSKFENKKIYSESSGSMAVLDSNIKMIMNDYGLYEEVLIDPTKEIASRIKNVSPNFNKEVSETDISNELYGSIDNISFDEKIGYYSSLYVGHATEEKIRSNASSGGMGTWILKELLDKNLVDYVIHVKKNLDSATSVMFKYDISSTVEEIMKGAKTRYYPVEFSEVMEKVRNIPGRYVIIGIPSFIYAIRLLAKQDKIIDERIKFTIGLICGHQKSSKFAEAMAWQAGIKPGDLIDIDFRYKSSDQPANNYAVKMTGYIDNRVQTIIKPTSELFGQNWGWGLFKPTASNYTDDVFNETADIVLGDAWLPDYTSDSEGNNVIIVRNLVINNLITEGIKSERLKLDLVDAETIFSSQAAHYRHTKDELVYRLYKKDQYNEWRPKKRVSASKNIPKSRQKIQDLREDMSIRSHILYAEAVKKGEFNYFVFSMNKFIDEYQKVYKKVSRQQLISHVLELGPKKSLKKAFNKFKKIISNL